MPTTPWRSARPALARFFGPLESPALDAVFATLGELECRLQATVDTSRGRSPLASLTGLAFREDPPHSCLVAQLRLGDLSAHLSVVGPGYYTSGTDALWRAELEAYLACGHPEHDIDPVITLPPRMAATPAEAVDAALALVQQLQDAAPTWPLDAATWHQALESGLDRCGSDRSTPVPSSGAARHLLPKGEG